MKRSNRITTKLGLAAIAIIASSAATADDSGWYTGINAGSSRADINEEQAARDLLGAGFTPSAIAKDNSELGYKAFAGYRINQYFALEGGYFELGQFAFTATTVPAGSLSGNVELRGLNFDPVLILPFTERLSVLARIGVHNVQAKSKFTGSGAATAPSSSRQRSTHHKYGVGLEYNLSNNFGLRAEAERYRIEDYGDNEAHVALYSIGAVYRFYGTSPPPVAHVASVPAPAPAPAPAPVAALPPPLPSPVASLPPPPERLKKVAFSADSFFDFDLATVKPAGQRELDALVADLRGTNYEAIMVSGHTDRIGSPDYNLRLSESRAEAVKSYLIQSGGIPSSKITARGLGEGTPVTQPGACQGRQSPKASPALIACLQTDRRVEVEVSGTKVVPAN